MKKLLFFSAVILLFLSACCDKKSCDGAIPSILPYGFDTTDMYSAVIERYGANSDFEERIDSFPLNATRFPSDGPITYSYDFQSGIDYKITFKESGKEFRITNVLLEQGVCDHCTFNMYGETYYDYFTRCRVNGVLQFGSLELHSQ